jgi:hypothetical protein
MNTRNIFTKASIAIGLVALAVFFTALSAVTAFACTSTPKFKVYYNPPRSEWNSVSPYLCDFNSDFKCTDIKLKGWLYLAEGETVASSKKNMPLIIYNHGSGQGVSDVCEMATYFNNHGYLFFVPFRRGHRGTLKGETQSSTGVYYQDYLDRFVCPTGICDATTSHLVMLDYLDQQTFEVRKAIDFMLGLKNSDGEPIADPEKIAVMGHSFGGIVTVFNNANMTRPKVFLPSAPASESWTAFDREDGSGLDDDSPSIQKLKAAALKGHAPAFFFEPTNDVSTHPIFVLSSMAAEIGPLFPPREYQAALFPAVPLAPGEDSSDAHVHFVLDHDQVQIWAPAARNFMARYGVK